MDRTDGRGDGFARQNSSNLEINATEAISADVSESAPVQVAQATQDQQTDGQTATPQVDLSNVSQTFTATPGGTVNLPAGTAIDQVLIQNGNLYLIQPDGSVILIVGGAANPPNLVIGTLQIPSADLAQAIEGAQEGVPTAGPAAAGQPQSSGGNFVVDPGDIGDGFPFGPILDLTELAFPLFPNEDFDEPPEEALVEEVDGVPIIGAPETIVIEEDDLEEGNDGDGSRPDAVMGTGNLGVDFGTDGPGTIEFSPGVAPPEGLTSDGEPIVYQLINGQTLIGFVDNDGNGTFDEANPELEIPGDRLIFEVVIDPSVPGGEYKFTLFDNIDHPDPSKDGIDGDPETLNDEELQALDFPFVVSDANGDTANGSFQVNIQDDIPEVMVPNQTKEVLIEIEKGLDEPRNEETEALPADPMDLLFKIPEGALGLQVDLTDIMTDTDLDNALGFYFADADGNPISGGIIGLGEDGSQTVTIDNIPDGAVTLGFFVLPNGKDLNPGLAENDQIFFQFNGETGLWEAFKVGETEPLATAEDFALFSDQRLNPDGIDFETMGLDGKDSSWEDTSAGTDEDFDDLQFNIKVSAKFEVEFLLQVDEDDILTSDSPIFTVEGSEGTSPNDGDEDGSVTGEPGVVDAGPAVAHASLGIKWGSDDTNLEPSVVGQPDTDVDGTEFFSPDDVFVDDDTIAIFSNDNGPHDFETGEKVIYTTGEPGNSDTFIGGLTPGAYYVIDNGNGTFKLAETLADALAGNAIDLTSQGDGTQFVHKAGDRSLIFDPALDGAEATLHDGTPLTSKGEQVLYQLSDDGTKLIAFVDGQFGQNENNSVARFIDDYYGGEGDGRFDPFGESGDRLVFEVELSDLGEGEVWFRLFDQIDHPNPGIEGEGPAVEDLVWLKFGFIATDSDGDMIMDEFVVDVKDDIPALTGDMIVETVDEDDIDTFEAGEGGPVTGSEGTSPDDGDTDGSFTGDPGVASGGPANVSGTLAGLVVGGSDETITFSFVGDAADQFNALGLSSKGEKLVFQVVEDTLTATAGDRLVFELTVDQDGEFTFELFDQMDHDLPFDEGGSGLADENFDLIDTVDGDISSLNFGKVVKVTDFDGDSVVLDNAFKIQIRDDVPELEEEAEPVTLTVDEDDINNEQSEGTSPNDGSGDGSVTGNPSSDEEGPAVASANLSGLVKSGADEELTFMFVNEAAAVEFLDGLGLRSQGELLSYDVSDDGSMLTATAGTGEDARIVFKLTVEPNGEVTFELFDQMDHDPPFDTDPAGFPADPAVPGDNPPLADQNTDLIDFDDQPPAEVREFDISQIDFGSIIKAVDFDGDAVVLDGQFGVSIRDDIPELTGKKVVKVVDEDDINTEQSEGTSPNDGTGDGSETGNPPSDATGPAFVSGSLAGVVTSGADEPLTFSFVDNAADQFNGLGLSSKGEELVFQVVGNELTASVGDRLVLK
ncbi:MAG: hypothetical protein MI824_06695, partial [Hyphomicrobiales bacterium]|nr:hypothetical protein [Hyphomicrobiales bacterium]